MILTGKNIDNRKIETLIGKPITINFKNPKAIGGPGLYLKSFLCKTENDEIIATNSKCNIEKRTNGILVHTNFLNRQSLIPIQKKEILEMEIIRGNEKVDPFFLSPMWILLKLGLSIRYARYFRLRAHEYSIENMKLNLDTKYYNFKFIASGYLFESQLNFINSLDYGKKIKVKTKNN